MTLDVRRARRRNTGNRIMKPLTTLALGAVLLLLSVAVGAQITLYGQEGLRGRSSTFENSVPSLQGSKLNDRASSLIVRGGSWQLCSEPYYRGSCVTVGPGEYRSLRAAGLDNRISSIREVGWQGGGGGGGGGNRGIVLYDQPNFAGRSIRIDGPVESLEQFNDRARSMIIYDGEWELCEHDRLRGNCMVFREGRHANLGPLSGDVSSVRPLSVVAPPAPGPGHGQIAGWGRGARAVLYEGPEFRGRSIVINEDVVDNLHGSGFNDRASSLRIERGYWVFCSDANFRGECRTFSPGDYARLPSGLNDRVSSGRRIYEDYPYDREPNWSRGR
jgi:Beta/Gamma crystallin